MIELKQYIITRECKYCNRICKLLTTANNINTIICLNCGVRNSISDEELALLDKEELNDETMKEVINQNGNN